jgi:hypothetical protein
MNPQDSVDGRFHNKEVVEVPPCYASMLPLRHVRGPMS